MALNMPSRLACLALIVVVYRPAIVMVKINALSEDPVVMDETFLESKPHSPQRRIPIASLIAVHEMPSLSLQGSLGTNCQHLVCSKALLLGQIVPLDLDNVLPGGQ
jgi:hypothetical protein